MFRAKSTFSFGISFVLAVIALAAPVNGQDNAQAKDVPDVEEPSKAQTELEVTADRVRQPLPTPQMDLRLPRINLTDMQPWNWDGVWHASEWDNGNSTIPWKYGRVRQGFSGDTHFVLNASGAPELKAQKGHPALRNGMYEVDVTIPAMRPGLVAAPIWLFNEKTQESIAIEVVGQRHLQMTLHGNDAGARKSEDFRMPGDFSGRRMRLAIRRHVDLGLIDMFVDGELVHTFNEDSSAFPGSAMRPIISLYAGDKHRWSRSWAGTWTPMTGGDRVSMTVHGYRYTAL